MKNAFKQLLRWFTTTFPVRGRHKLVDVVGKKLSSEIEIYNLNGFNLAIDHKIRSCRNMYYGVYEEGLVNFLKKNMGNGSVILEPGANIGYITANCVGLVGEKGHVHSFEPSKTCYNQIADNNDFSKIKNLTFLNSAISDKTGEANFFDTPRVVSAGFAVLRETDSPEAGVGYQIPIFSVDDYCSENNIDRVAFLKLDVEGSELPALRGATRMLANKAIDFILVETYIDKSIESLNEINGSISEILERNGYAPHDISRNGDIHSIDLDKTDKVRTDLIWKPA